MNHACINQESLGHPHLKPVVGIWSGWDFVLAPNRRVMFSTYKGQQPGIFTLRTLDNILHTENNKRQYTYSTILHSKTISILRTTISTLMIINTNLQKIPYKPYESLSAQSFVQFLCHVMLI